MTGSRTTARRLLVVARSTTSHNGHGGMETATVSLLSWLARSGKWDLGLVTTNGFDPAHAAIAFEQVWVVPRTRAGRYSISWWLSTSRVGPWLEWQPDALLSVSVAGAGIARQMASKRTVSVSHGTAVGDLRSRMRAARKASGAIALFGQLVRVAAQAVAVVRDRLAYRCFDEVLAVSDTVRDQLVGRPISISSDRTRVVPNGIAKSHSTYDPSVRAIVRAELGFAEGDSVLLFVGRVDLEKGIRECLDVVHLLGHRYKLLVVGDGPAMDLVRERIHFAGESSQIVTVGRVLPNNVARYFSGSDVLLMPTHRVEGLPMVVLEAMQSGLPIVCSARANVPHGKPEVIVAEPSPQALKAAILSVDRSFGRVSYVPSSYEIDVVGADVEQGLS